ncbi:MAG TPA: hypothetical protein VK668_19600 [Mucilaginibacter sp.]|nr:hypothetical protein [Mucilaginibacter sp.]
MMKLLPRKTISLKPLLAIMVCVALIYTSCRKADNSPIPSDNTAVKPTNDTISGQIALNLAQSLAGNYGGVNIMDGVDSVSLAGHNGPQHAKNGSALCGFFTDSLVDYNRTVADTTYHTGGNLTFYFDCKDGKPTGYTAYDSLMTMKITPQATGQYFVKQYYTIKCLTDDRKFIGVNGDLYYEHSTITQCTCHSTHTEVENANYVLKDLKINVCGCSRDILSGTATFKAYGRNWSVTGSITFLGNYRADVLINGVVYHVDMKTHKVIA